MSVPSIFVATALALLLPELAASQSIVGRAVVDGKVALLRDDGTWSFEVTGSGGGADCEMVVVEVEFCGKTAGWVSIPPPTAEINKSYRIDARHYAQYLIEDLGTDDGLTVEFFRKAIIDNMERVSGFEPEVIDLRPVTLGNLTGETIIYRARIDGLSVVFANSLFLSPKRAMQIITYGIAGEYTSEHEMHHSSLISFTKVAE